MKNEKRGWGRRESLRKTTGKKKEVERVSPSRTFASEILSDAKNSSTTTKGWSRTAEKKREVGRGILTIKGKKKRIKVTGLCCAGSQRSAKNTSEQLARKKTTSGQKRG